MVFITLDTCRQQTGTSLETHPLGYELRNCNSAEDAIAIFSYQARAVDEFRPKRFASTKRLTPVVNIVLILNDTLSHGINLKSPPENIILSGINVPLAVRPFLKVRPPVIRRRA
ncbi:hypothetical protein OBBRIDRAFT_789098 [Obba rivulosa]|uniref:Uncharacterized protein n=1 Tax=Obba rivulosa TaxID=1052685 RepID=A0A8E2DRZ3_9APHY|nr:hypothetical protein OBBRIDRAFT_789098 [Obba rivulosa]